MAVPFDHIAPTYDSVFTKSMIGQMQRKEVWKYVEHAVIGLKGFEMLELNCGTGEDAVLFGGKGFNIVATDVSQEMLKITREKAEQFSMQNKISSQYLDLETFDETLFDKKFDLVFSNFGGLNCINPDSFKKLLNKLPDILNPGGRFIAIVMPRVCAWEIMFFLLRLQFRKAFRRMTSKEVRVNLQGVSMNTWYYKPAQVRKWSKKNFNVVSVRPVGLILPPSYLENFFTFRKRLLIRLSKLEKKFNQYSLFSGMSDHFLIDLQLK